MGGAVEEDLVAAPLGSEGDEASHEHLPQPRPSPRVQDDDILDVAGGRGPVDELGLDEERRRAHDGVSRLVYSNEDEVVAGEALEEGAVHLLGHVPDACQLGEGLQVAPGEVPRLSWADGGLSRHGGEGVSGALLHGPRTSGTYCLSSSVLISRETGCGGSCRARDGWGRAETGAPSSKHASPLGWAVSALGFFPSLPPRWRWWAMWPLERASSSPLLHRLWCRGVLCISWS